METEAMVEHLIEAHGASDLLRLTSHERAKLNSAHWASHVRGRSLTGKELLTHEHEAGVEAGGPTCEGSVGS